MEELIKLLLSNSVNILYSNIDGKEKLVINGKEITKKFNDNIIKEKIKDYKQNLEDLDDYIFAKVLEEAENRDLDIAEMSNKLDAESFTENEAKEAEQIIEVMNDLISDVIHEEIEKLFDALEIFKRY